MTDDELLKKFKSLNKREDIADLLEVSNRDLIYYLYRIDEKLKYRTFKINKKSGGYREIYSPSTSLKILQKKLNYILSIENNLRASAHGFIRDRSIVSNASLHVGKKYVFNIDLDDFFPTINFGRVRGLFLNKPFNFNHEVATSLAQICCFQGVLPQGAPTSPIISNMICFKLDGLFQKLAKQNNCIYTRYADDISFSFTQNKLPSNIVKVNYIDGSKVIEVGEKVEDIIKMNGFSINEEKIRLQSKYEKQEVTGVKVNQFLNVKRRMIRQVRAMLFAWEKFGLENAQSEYYEKYSFRQKNPKFRRQKFNKVLQGKINYIKMIRGESDYIYKKYQNKYNKLAGIKYRLPMSNNEELLKTLWILECDECTSQGTAFMTEYGLVTCDHVLSDSIKAFKWDDCGKQYPVEVIKRDKTIDLALLKIDVKNEPYLKIKESSVEYRQKLTVAGFPGYMLGSKPHIMDARVTTTFVPYSGINRFYLDSAIFYGGSGGPILNQSNEVVGVAVTGAESIESANKTHEYGSIPISALKKLINL